MINNSMDDMYQMKSNAGLLKESKYGSRFDQFKPPFKNDGKDVVDYNSKELAECKNAETAKELAAILNDLIKMREAAEKIMTLWR